MADGPINTVAAQLSNGRVLVQHCPVIEGRRLDGDGRPLRYMYALAPTMRIQGSKNDATGICGGYYVDKRGRTWAVCHGMTELAVLRLMSGPSVVCGEFEMFCYGMNSDGGLIDLRTGMPVL